MKDFSITDTQILDLYLGILFATKRFDEAEQLLNYVYKTKISPTVFLAFAQLYEIKYNDFTKAQEFLKESFKYFPYDARTLETLANFYLQTRDPSNYAYFSYLYGLRSHSLFNLEEAHKIYETLGNTKMASIVLNNIEIIRRKIPDNEKKESQKYQLRNKSK